MTGPGRAGRAGVEPDEVDPLAEAVRILTRIRAEGEWESAQTHESLLSYLVEETWELVDAVADGDRVELRSELGDLLLQVLFHCAIAAEHPDDPFDIGHVAQTLVDKVRRRAPYWFTDEGPAGLDAGEQDRLWQEAKKAERAGRPPRGIVEGISWGQPALALGQTVVERALAAGLPEDLIPGEVTTVRVAPRGVAHESGSVEVAYRDVVRRFARRLQEAERHLGAAAGTAQEWRQAWAR